MSGDIRTFRNIYATNSFCLRDETSCDEDKGVNPHNPGGGRGGRGERMFTKLHSELQMFSSQAFCPSGGGG